MPGDIDAGVSHRKWLNLGAAARPLEDTPSVFARIGGQAAVDRLVDSLYDRFETDRVLRPLFAKDLTRDRNGQKRFFAEWLGGPPRYSESSWGGLYHRHEDLPITTELAARWLGHFEGALAEAVADERDRTLVLERVRAVAHGLVNHVPDPTETGPSPKRGTPKHRSQVIASCGVGARTLQQGLTLARGGQLAELVPLVLDVPDFVARAAFGARLLRAAALHDRIEVVEWLLDQGVDVNQPWSLATAVSGGALEGVLFVTPLCAARMARRADAEALLLGRGARDDVFTAALLGDQAAVDACLTGEPSLAQVADPATDVVTITPVHHAVAGGHLAVLLALLDHAAGGVRTGGRALRAAAERGRADMIDALLDHGADARAVGAGRWVLDVELAPRLAGAGASAALGPDGAESGDWVKLSCTGNQGRKDNPDLVAALLHYGARVDQRYNGATSLHYAAKAGFLKTIGVLLDAGADRGAVDARGRTPRDWLAQASKSVDREAVLRALA